MYSPSPNLLFVGFQVSIDSKQVLDIFNGNIHDDIWFEVYNVESHFARACGLFGIGECVSVWMETNIKRHDANPRSTEDEETGRHKIWQ